MRRKLIIDGNAVYEIDDECARCQEKRQEADQKKVDSCGGEGVCAEENDKRYRNRAKTKQDVHFYKRE